MDISGVFSSTTGQKHQSLSSQPSLWTTLTFVHDYWKKTIALTIWTFLSKVMFLLFNILSRFVIAFVSRSNRLFISWLQSPSTVILESEISITVSTFAPAVCHKVIGLDAIILSFKLSFSLSSFTLITRLLISSSLLPLEWYHLHIWGCWYFSWQSWFQLVTHPAWLFEWYTLHTS